MKTLSLIEDNIKLDSERPRSCDEGCDVDCDVESDHGCDCYSGNS